MSDGTKRNRELPSKSPDVAPVSRAQVIDAHHFLATVQMVLDHMGTDESCPAGD